MHSFCSITCSNTNFAEEQSTQAKNIDLEKNELSKLAISMGSRKKTRHRNVLKLAKTNHYKAFYP